ncbi:MAG TPA: hypothetical protein VLK33_11605 [Terriglobales bacterium]|nr:hypothetical protein [Terriglobales bacterium]
MTRLVLLLALISGSFACAQMPIPADKLPAVSRLFENLDKRSTLQCAIEHFDPFLDFTFRYEAGLVITIGAAELTPGTRLKAFLRVTPRDGKPEFFGEQYDVAPIPAAMAKKLSPRDLKRIQLQMSAGFAIGDGHYAIDLLLADSKDRTCYARWNLKTPKHDYPLALPPNKVTTIEADANAWDGKLQSDGAQLTVLLHVTPINPNSPRLHAWDRGFLLDSLTSLLKQFHSRSVRVIAFNLDQQHELFRDDHFNSEGFYRLAHTLHELEFGTVSYQALQRDSWRQWLTHLADEQITTKDPSDVVVFLGPASRFRDKVSAEARDADTPPRFFYLEYYPWRAADFSDSIDSLTRGMHGTVYKIHSADQLRWAIQKMSDRIKQKAKTSASSVEKFANTP